MKRFTTEISVRYGETDKMGIAHHTSYLLWFEIGRTGLLRLQPKYLSEQREPPTRDLQRASNVRHGPVSSTRFSHLVGLVQ